MSKCPNSLKPFFTYYGGKWRAAPHYSVPHYNEIIEPFAGSAGYSLRYPDCDVLLVDEDLNVLNTWRYLLSTTPAEIRDLPDLVNDQCVDDLDVPDGAKLLIGWWLNKGCSAPCKRPSKWMRAGGHTNSFWGPTIRERIASQLPRIKHWRVQEGSYTWVHNRPATWFIDPPYEGAGKRYRHGSKDLCYRSLAKWCLEREGQIIVCENVGADWLPFKPWRDIKANARTRVSREALFERAA